MRVIYQMEPWLGEEEKEEIIRCLDSGWITEAKRTRQFEEMFAQYVGSRYACAVTSGTISLAVALMALSVGPGDEVIVPDLTMIASANAVRLAGATPVLADTELETLGLDVAAVERTLTPRTKAIMPVHFNGRAPNMERLLALAYRHDLAVVEDAAQALGSRHQGKHLGSFGQIGCFSLSTPKIITTGQGGVLVTNSSELQEHIICLKDHGRLNRADDNHPVLGFNFKFTDMQAAIGIAQLRKLEERVGWKKEMYHLYREELSAIEAIRFATTELEQTCPWFIDIMVPDPQALQAFLEERGIQTRLFYKPLHTQPVYAREGPFPNAEEASRHGIFLPSSSFLSDSDIRYICQQIKEFYA